MLTIPEYFKTRPFAKIGLIAIPMLVLTTLMKNYFPQTSPEGFKSFILAFEFAKTPEQIHQIFNGFTTDTIGNIDMGNYIDFGFMVAYTLFLALFFHKTAKIFNKKWLMVGIPLSVIVMLADVVENIYLLQITTIYSPTVTDAELISVLNKLHFITWVKWGGLAIIFALYGIQSLQKKIQSYIAAVVFIIPLLLSIWALSNDPAGVSRFTQSISLVFFILIVYCFWYKEKIIKKEFSASIK